MLDRLVELIRQADAMCGSRKQCEGCVGFGKGADCCDYNIADCLLANGVIVPPCKVGDTVYVIVQDSGVWELDVRGAQMTVGINGQGAVWMRWSFVSTDTILFKDEDIGKSVFLTREEAEQVLKGAGS